jgi:two-component system, OmpR family, response regulator
VLQRALADAGADVWVAPDGPGAVQTARQSPPDIIVLDLGMPGMDGWAVIAALKAAGVGNIPVVLQTSEGDYTSFERARREGVAAFLSKPFRLTQVIETCRRIVHGARPLQGVAEKEPDHPVVQVRDTQGNLLTSGHVLDLAPNGARLDLETPLSPGQRVTLTLHMAEALQERRAEVRWANKIDGRFHHGVALRD